MAVLNPFLCPFSVVGSGSQISFAQMAHGACISFAGTLPMLLFAGKGNFERGWECTSAF